MADQHSSDDLHSTVATRLLALDQRYTSNRRAVVEVLEESDRPLTIAEILGRRPLAQSSVYRNLVVLEEAHVVHRVISTDEYARYELAEDLTDHHHHLICATCGVVEDFTVAPQLERTLESAMATVAAETGFQPERHRLDLVGTCGACSADR